MKRPRASHQNEVEGNVLRQNERQRCKVRKDTPMLADILENQAWMRPWQQQAKTTTRPTYTLRPRNRTDSLVLRRRHLAQQKLKRNENAGR